MCNLNLLYFVFAFISLCSSSDISKVESCTEKVKKQLTTDADTQESYNSVVNSDGDLIGFYVNTINTVCNSKEADATVTFFTENANALISLTEFTKTLTPEELNKFTTLQRNSDFTEELKFIKEKYDASNSTGKSHLKNLLQQLVPMLIQEKNVKPAVKNYFDSISPQKLIKIIGIAEKHNITALKTFVVGTFKELQLNKTDRETVGKFIDRIYKVKQASTSKKNRSNPQ